MIALFTIVGAVLAAIGCRVGHVLGAANDNATNALRVVGGTLLFAMAAGALGEGMVLGALTAALCAVFVSVGGIDILRAEMRLDGAAQHDVPDDSPVARDGDTMEMPVVIRDAA